MDWLALSYLDRESSVILGSQVVVMSIDLWM